MNVYLIGIGGSSMSAIARLLSSQGHRVCGSDRTETEVTVRLREEGIPVRIGHDESVAGFDVVVYTCGVGEENPQRSEAARLGIPLYERAQALGLLSLEYDRVIAVAGTHGKTTTAAMIAHLLKDRNPTLHIGAEGSRIGGRELLITEACEYRNSFLSLRPDIAVILNIECDHPDFYRSTEALDASFAAFAARVRKGGRVFVHESAMSKIARKSVTFGASGDYSYGGAEYREGCASFDVFERGDRVARLSLSLPGAQWIPDALAAAAVARGEGVPWDRIETLMSAFSGVARRWQVKGVFGGAQVVADYAHHPTQIRAVIETAKLMGKRPVVVFQPHTYSRTRALFRDYARVLAAADPAIITDIYAARESRDASVSAAGLASAVTACGGNGLYAPSFDAAVRMLGPLAASDAVFLILGAGDVTRIAEALLRL